MKTKNWAELPPELTSSILLHLGAIEILQNAQNVCKSWRRVCTDPSMWQKIDMRSPDTMDYDIEAMCRHAVDRTQGGLLEITIENFGSDSLLAYIAHRSSNLRCLRIAMLHRLTSEGLVNAVIKFPLLEVLEISHRYSKLNLKVIGHSCPFLKTLKVNCSRKGIKFFDFECDDGDALAIAESMPKLRDLKLSRNKLTNIGLNAIVENCRHLEHLYLHQCFNVNIVGDMEKQR